MNGKKIKQQKQEFFSFLTNNKKREKNLKHNYFRSES